MRIKFVANTTLGVGAPISLFDFAGCDQITFIDHSTGERILVPTSIFTNHTPLIASFCSMQTIEIPTETECTLELTYHTIDFVPRYNRSYFIGTINDKTYKYFGGRITIH